MIRLLFLFLFTFCINSLFAQLDKNSYVLCEGSVNIFKSDTYLLKFKGHEKESTIFKNYIALQNETSGNLIWTTFIAPTDGKLEFTAKSSGTGVKFIIFEPFIDEVCAEIPEGNAEIKRMMLKSDSNEIGLNETTGNGFLYPLELSAGKLVQLVFIGELAVKDEITLNFNFTPFDEEEISESKELDLRHDDFAPTFKISIRDAKTKKPLIANLVLEGLKEINGLYKGSDMLFNVSRNCRLNLKCEAEGFFFVDSANIVVSSTTEQELVLYLEPVRAGFTMQIEEIEFVPGTSEIVLNSEGKLRRLRDFLVLNTDVHIEIQGHVFEPGEHNSYAGQKVSEARAKRVMKYLIDNGIDKSRLTAIGYGNTKPIYPEPKHAYEEQANRRVEVVVK